MTGPPAPAAARALSRRRRRVFILLAAVLPLMVGECAARALFPPRSFPGGWTDAPHAFSQPPGMRYALASNFNFGGLITNNQAMAYTPDVAVEKPRGVARVLTLGGSSMQGLSGTAEASPATHLRRFLERDFGARRVQVLNGACQGYTFADSLKYLVARGIAFSPDVVVVYHAWNDIEINPFFDKDQAARETRPPRWAVPPAQRDYPRDLGHRLLDGLSNVSRLVGQARMLRAAGANRAAGDDRPYVDPPALPEPGPNKAGLRDIERTLKRIAAVCAERGAVVVGCLQPLGFTRDGMARESRRTWRSFRGFGPRTRLDILEAIHGAVRRHSQYVADATREIAGRPEYFLDHVHLTPAGAHAVGRRIYEVVKPLVAARLGE